MLLVQKTVIRHGAVATLGAVLLIASAVHVRAKEDESDSPPKASASAVKEQQSEATSQAESVKNDAQKAGPYWIGVRCVSPIPEIVRSHVDVPEDSGVFVVKVVPGGPAAEAGVIRNDIILSAAGTPLQTVADLVAAVDRTAGQSIAVEILRGARRQTLEITPRQRPLEFADKGPLDIPRGSKWHKLGKWFDDNLPGMDGRPPLRMRFMHPGIILPPGGRNHPPLPTDMTVSITREGDGPAQIVVKRNNETWELSENDLDKLPPDVRSHVARMLGHVSMPDDVMQSLRSHFQTQLDAMDRHMIELKEMAEQLRQERLLFERQKDAAVPADP